MSSEWAAAGVGYLIGIVLVIFGNWLACRLRHNRAKGSA